MNSLRFITTTRSARRYTKYFLYPMFFVTFVFFVPSRYAGFEVSTIAADNARQIVEEAQKRTVAKSRWASLRKRPLRDYETRFGKLEHVVA